MAFELEYIKTIEGFNSQYIMPETTKVNNEDLNHLEQKLDKILANSIHLTI